MFETKETQSYCKQLDIDEGGLILGQESLVFFSIKILKHFAETEKQRRQNKKPSMFSFNKSALW
jgi:hypothetical protein